MGLVIAGAEAGAGIEAGAAATAGMVGAGIAAAKGISEVAGFAGDVGRAASGAVAGRSDVASGGVALSKLQAQADPLAAYQTHELAAALAARLAPPKP
jgi:hypothetical protein